MEYLSLCDKPRSGWPQFLDVETQKAVIEEDNRQTCVELAESFRVSDETITPAPHSKGVHVEQVGNLHTVGSEHAATSYSLFLVAFLGSPT